MISRLPKYIALALLLLLLTAPAGAVQIKAIEFSGLDEAQILNVRSELSLADTQLDTSWKRLVTTMRRSNRK
jgi:hypothetical protein